MAVAIVVGCPATAEAADWDLVGKGLVDSSRPWVGQVGRQAGITWSSPNGALYSRAVGKDGRLGATDTILQGWAWLSPDPVRVGRRVVTAGLRGVPGSGLFWPGNAFVAGDGSPVAVTDSQFAYVSQGQDAAAVDGRLVYAYTDGAASVRVKPEAANETQIRSGTAYFPAIAATASNAWLSWYSADGQQGVQVAPVTGLPAAPAIGGSQVAPGSDFRRPDQRVALAARGAAAWLAYPVADDVVRVWRAGDTRWLDLPTPTGLAAVDLSFSADGRLWLGYTTGNAVCTRRSDAFLTRFGEPTCKQLALPTSVALAGGEVVATSAAKAWHARFSPTPAVRPRRTAGTVRVTDAGTPVVRARVVVGQKTVRTNRRGLARVGPWPRGQRVVVRASGYEVVRVRG